MRKIDAPMFKCWDDGAWFGVNCRRVRESDWRKIMRVLRIADDVVSDAGIMIVSELRAEMEKFNAPPRKRK